MKKSLLFAALVMGAMSVSAQEYCKFDEETSAIPAEAVAVSGGTLVGASDNVEMYVAYDDNCKSVDVKFSGYDKIVVNGSEYEIGRGITGSNNPSGQALADGASTPPVAGFVVNFKVKADGFLTVIAKLSSNKEYYVWEGDANYALPVAYNLAMDWSAAAVAEHPTLAYGIPANEDGYVDFSASNIATYLNGTKFYWPEQIVIDPSSAVKVNGVGVITFPVYKDAENYLVQAAGSKISTCGAIFTTEAPTSVTLQSSTGEAADVFLFGQPTDINGVVSAEKANANAPVYNLAGQRVNNNFKGIAIQNGKKFVK